MMEVEKLKIDGNKDYLIKFILKNTTPAFANTIRRLIILEVPTLAIDTITVMENTTALFDEYIGHRLGLIPLWSDIEYLSVHDECTYCIENKQDGCSQCTVELELQVETDKVNKKTINSKELIPRDPDYFPVFENIPIIKMGTEERVHIYAIAKLGRGKNHARWNPVGTIGFQYMPSIKISKKASENEELVASCPQKVFEMKKGKLKATRKVDCNLCNQCVDASQGAIKVAGIPNNIIFTIESTRVLYIDSIVIKASEIFDKKIDTFLVSLQNALQELEEV